MTKFLSSISFIILSVFSLQANENSALFDNSNEQYLQENYEQAIVGYLLLEKEGFCSFNLHFNSGNAYFELADWKNAILQYERALLHQPNSKKAIHNLEIAISH
ncbi:MAG: tetratricopeptide repeat protein, partial [Chitinophagales bacterium]